MPRFAKGGQNLIGGDTASCQVKGQAVIQQCARMVRVGDNKLLAGRNRCHAVFPAIGVCIGDCVHPHRVFLDAGPGRAVHGRGFVGSCQCVEFRHGAGGKPEQDENCQRLYFHEPVPPIDCSRYRLLRA